jgi:hypothetical protein
MRSIRLRSSPTFPDPERLFDSASKAKSSRWAFRRHSSTSWAAWEPSRRSVAPCGSRGSVLDMDDYRHGNVEELGDAEAKVTRQLTPDLGAHLSCSRSTPSNGSTVANAKACRFLVGHLERLNQILMGAPADKIDFATSGVQPSISKVAIDEHLADLMAFSMDDVLRGGAAKGGWLANA